MKYAWVHQIELLSATLHTVPYEAIISETAKQYSDEEVRSFWSNVDAVLAEMKADGSRAE